jgi:transposase
MVIKNLFEQALNINSPWYIKSIEFEVEKKRLNIHVDFKRGATFKDESEEGKQAHKVYDTIDKRWRHLNFFQHECHLCARVPRVKRSDGKVRLILPPWSGRMSGFTLLFEALLLQLCRSMPVHNVSQLTGVSDYKIWRMLEIYVGLAKQNEEWSKLDTLGMDETSVAKGHDYITLFVDLEERKTCHISDGKDHQTVAEFVEILEAKQGDRRQVKQVSCDMSPAFIKGVGEYLPKAEITFDKFHIMKIINGGVDKVRREESKTNPLLKGNRYIFLKNEDKLTKNQREIKQELSLSKLNLKAMRALRIREAFQEIYQADRLEDFEVLLNKWYFWATHSQLKPIIKAAKTIKRHWTGVVKWKESQINNGILEGLNSVLQAAKRKARGYKKRHFKIIAYLMTAKLDFSNINSNCLPFLPT